MLLYLVSRERIDIGTISISEIADQYVDEVSHMENLDLNTASDFLLVASTLLEIKAHSLLPQDQDTNDAEVQDLDPEQARHMLIEKLLLYKQFKNASLAMDGRLKAQSHLHTRSFGPDESLLHVMPDYLENVSLQDIARACAHSFARRDTFLLESDHIARKPIPVEAHVQSIYHRLTRERQVSFSDLVHRSTPTPVVVVTFLAILELYKRNLADVRQDRLFDDIIVTLKDRNLTNSNGLSKAHAS